MNRGSGGMQCPDSEYEDSNECNTCHKKFHAFRRKHRCRSCGNAVCGSCARTHKVMPSSTIMRYNNEPVRVCDRCIRDQNQMQLERRRAEDLERTRARQIAVAEEEQRMRAAEQMRREQEIAESIAREKTRVALKLRTLEEKYLGPRPERSKLRRSRSLDDCVRHVLSVPTQERDLFIADAEKRSYEIMAEFGGVNVDVSTASVVVQEADECAICLETMDVGQAIYTTGCGHSFHWSCLKDIQSSGASNFDKCPSCRATMHEMQVKKQCDHPRVRIGHRFCRDCGNPVTERDAKPRANEQEFPVSNGMPPAPEANQPVSYRANSHGALVRCPQCQIQMRVLPNMYNLRVACPSGHMFLVQVAGDHNTMGSTGMGYGMGMGMGGPRGGSSGGMQPRGLGYPGSSYYRPANSYSEL